MSSKEVICRSLRHGYVDESVFEGWVGVCTCRYVEITLQGCICCMNVQDVCVVFGCGFIMIYTIESILFMVAMLCWGVLKRTYFVSVHRHGCVQELSLFMWGGCCVNKGVYK